MGLVQYIEQALINTPQTVRLFPCNGLDRDDPLFYANDQTFEYIHRLTGAFL